MKALISCLAIFLFVSSFLMGDSKAISLEMRACQSLGGSLDFRLNQEKKDLPTSWDDFELIFRMKNGMVQHQLALAKAINSLALVPDSPIIKAERGILREYHGCRLVVISRNENTTKNSGNFASFLLPVLAAKAKNSFQSMRISFPRNRQRFY